METTVEIKQTATSKKYVDGNKTMLYIAFHTMADITMCRGEGCSKKESCFRHKAKSNENHQSWFIVPSILADGNCEYYWPFESKKELEQLNIENADWP